MALSDSVTDADEDPKSGNGFCFHAYDSFELDATLRRACEAFQDDRWRRIVENGMRQDWSWKQSAREYVSLYERTLARRREQQTA